MCRSRLEEAEDDGGIPSSARFSPEAGPASEAFEPNKLPPRPPDLKNEKSLPAPPAADVFSFFGPPPPPKNRPKESFLGSCLLVSSD